MNIPLIYTNSNLSEIITNDKNVHNYFDKTQNQDPRIKDLFQRLQDQIKESYEKMREKIEEIDQKGIDLKKVGVSLLGATMGALLAYSTFNFALIPISFLVQLLLAGGVASGVPQQLIPLLQSMFSVGVASAHYFSTIAGALAGTKTTNQIIQPPNSINTEELKIALEKLKNSENIQEYIRNGFNLGAQWAKETNEKAGNWGSVPLALAMSGIMMAPLALLVTALSLGSLGVPAALVLGFLVSLPLGIKTFRAIKDFAKDVYGLIGGVIGGAVGASIGALSKIFNKAKTLFSKNNKNKKEEIDEFQKNSPYKSQGIEEIMESTGKLTESFIKGSSDVLSFTALINNILTRNPNGLGVTASIVGGTVKTLEGASIMKNAGLENKPEEFHVGLFRFLSGFSMLLSFLAPLLGPMAVVGFSILSLTFMGIEKIFALKNKLSQKDQKEDNEQALKNSYAVGTATGDFVSGLGSLGKFWMGWDTIFGGTYGGLTSIFGLIGATKDIIQGAKMMQISDQRNNTHIGIMGMLSIIGGISLALAAIGLGRIFGAISLGTEILKLIMQIHSLTQKDNQTNLNLNLVRKEVLSYGN
ncbi:MAG: hypothetical protein RMJ51_05160 [Candidatus Calescibacterium sp.]|nr:hypothetical protein [Candidatus Calescibacterium sp.]MDW8195609.1 hypothetical protein [Candidatus Calescibacterium sp.]